MCIGESAMIGRFVRSKSIPYPCLLLLSLLIFHNIYASNISGFVYDNKRNALPDIDIELLDDYYRLINRTKTNGSGRYEFGGLRDGRFTVRVLPFKYDLQDSSAMVEVTTINSIPGDQGNTYMTQDFYLIPKKGSLMDTELGVVFAQEIPKEAEKLFKDSIKDLSKKKNEEGISGLRKAISIFPNYYLALHTLGKELFQKQQYGEAAQLFIKASEVNTKSPTNYYYLGYALSKLNYNKAALISLNQALLLAPLSTQVLYVLGTVEEAEGKYTEAEKHLLHAKKLSKVSSPDIHWHLAQVYKNLKKYKESADELEAYLKSGNFSEEHVAKVKKVIEDLQKKRN